MNKRETFYFTPAELEMMQIMGITRKGLKARIHAMLKKELREYNLSQKQMQEIVHAKWIVDED